MRTFFTLWLLTALAAPARAQPTSYREVNTRAAVVRQRAALAEYPNLYLNFGQFKIGWLYLPGGRRYLVPGLRYHVGERLLEVQDSLNPDSIHYWPLAALRGFDLGDFDAAPLPGGQSLAPIPRYRVRLVSRGAGHATRPEAVQVLTATDGGPLLLAYLPTVDEKGRLVTELLASSSDDARLRPFALSPKAVLHQLGPQATAAQQYARLRGLSLAIPLHVARLFDFYNQQVLIDSRLEPK